MNEPFVVLDTPSQDELLMDFPHGIYKDLVDNIFAELHTPYYYTFADHPTISLPDEILSKDPYVIFLLGANTVKKVLNKKVSMRDSIGKKFIVYTDDSSELVERSFIVNYHPSYVLNRGKRELEEFKSVFRVNL